MLLINIWQTIGKVWIYKISVCNNNKWTENQFEPLNKRTTRNYGRSISGVLMVIIILIAIGQAIQAIAKFNFMNIIIQMGYHYEMIL